MSDINSDKKVLEKGRSFKLKDNEEEGLQVVAPLRDQIVKDLYNKLTDEKDSGSSVVHQVADIWYRGDSNRAEWLERQAEYIVTFDEFIEPIHEAPTEWSSNIHLPVVFTICKTFHARFFSALLGINPPLSVSARQAAWEQNQDKVQQLMGYTLKDWMNHNNGIEETADRWLWDWITTGTGILKSRWEKKFTKFKDVEVVSNITSELVPDEEGNLVEVPRIDAQEREVDRIIEVFNGPCTDRVNVEDLLIIGGEGDPQQADYVMQQTWMTSDELYQLADQKIFDEDAVEAVIESGRNSKLEGQGNNVKQRRADTAGDQNLDKSEERDRYRIIEAHCKVDVDESGIASDIIMWLHPNTRELLRATYAYRVYPHAGPGLIRPFFKIDFHKRQDQTYGAGIPELLYSLAKEIDAMHNMRIDTGILTTLPFGFYRPSSSMEKEIIAFEPGTMIPVDDPQAVFFPNLASKTNFGLQEEQLLTDYIQKMVSLSDLNMGIISGQGATRTATGTRALVGEANANLDIYLKRMNRGWKQFLQQLFAMLQTKLPEGMQFRVVGEDGKSYWSIIHNRQEIDGMYDFELEPNSSNSNPQIRIQRANQIYQMTQNPIDLQLGIVTPQERYEALKDLLQSMGVRNVSKYIRKPQTRRQFTPEEIFGVIMTGEVFQFQPTDDLQGFVTYAEMILNEDSLNGQLNIEVIQSLQAHLQQAQQLLASLQQAQSQAANLAQQAVNAENSTGLEQPLAINAQANVQTPTF
jgi:hypothetical protein